MSLNNLLIIEGFDALNGDPVYNYDGFDELLPPDMGGLDSLTMLTDMVPSRDELLQTAAAGSGMAGAMIGGLALESILRDRLKVPGGLLPVVHIGLGVVAGKVISRWNPALGVGVAAGLAGLGIIRFLQSYLGVSVNLTGLDDFSLADFGTDDGDLLPAELQGSDDDYMDAIGMDEDDGMGSFSAVVASESLEGYRLM